ncbi:hypothetical protein ACFY5J_08305 [Peribacillus butanolivorans]|uniref:hypothetical protein n=1 Tax=Peribacillus butanolivorans TaxID=421767 RepID=UPI00367E2C5E
MQSITSGQSVSSPIEIKGSTSLKNGQILFGKVNRVHPNQTTEVQIGHQKMIATLDIPLQAGEMYWFQVQQPNEGKVVLKVLDSPNVNFSSLKGAAAQLLSHLGISPEPEAASLAEYLLKNQLPITKDTFLSALQWVKTADAEEYGLSIIKRMFLQQLPFVEDVFVALLAQAKGEPFHKLLSGLQQQLKDSVSETSVKLKGVLDSLHVAKQDQLQQTGLQKLVTTWIDSSASPELKNGAFSLLQKTGFVPMGITEAGFLEKFFVESAEISGSTKNSVTDKLQKGLQLLSDAKNGTLGKVEKVEYSLNRLLNGLDYVEAETSTDIKSIQQKTISTEELSALASRLLERTFAEASAGNRIAGAEIEVNDLIAHLNKDIEKVTESKGKVTELLIQSLKRRPEALSVTNAEKLVLTQVLETEFQTIDFTNGASVAQQLKEWTKMLGLQLEHALANMPGDGLEDLTKDLETLKPLLLKLLNEQNPASVKELAEQILNRITAQQILSQETGPLQNLLLTLPLNLGSSKTDLTLQWSGRKKKDGKIDPDYCRILFCLELERLKETFIDMQVQNRVIKVTVINEYSKTIEAAADNYLTLLKANLKKMDYSLSGVLFENPVSKKTTDTKLKSALFSEKESYSGVDIRI